MADFTKRQRCQQITGGFARWRQYPRRNDSAKLKVTAPQQVQWKPPPRKAAWTLAVTRETASRKVESD